MMRDNLFPELMIENLMDQNLEFDLVGKASIASRQIELFGTMTAMQQMMQIAQFKPDILDNVDADKTARFIQEVNMCPVELQLPEADVQMLREQRAQAAAAAEQRAEMQALGDMYAKSTKAPEEGSSAQALGEMMMPQTEG